MTLLEKAQNACPDSKQGASKRVYDEEQMLDLAIAYAKKELTGIQVKAALGSKNTNVQHHMGATLLSAIRKGRLEVKKR